MPKYLNIKQALSLFINQDAKTLLSNPPREKILTSVINKCIGNGQIDALYNTFTSIFKVNPLYFNSVQYGLLLKHSVNDFSLCLDIWEKLKIHSIQIRKTHLDSMLLASLNANESSQILYFLNYCIDNNFNISQSILLNIASHLPNTLMVKNIIHLLEKNKVTVNNFNLFQFFHQFITLHPTSIVGRRCTNCRQLLSNPLPHKDRKLLINQMKEYIEIINRFSKYSLSFLDKFDPSSFISQNSPPYIVIDILNIAFYNVGRFNPFYINIAVNELKKLGYTIILFTNPQHYHELKRIKDRCLLNIVPTNFDDSVSLYVAMLLQCDFVSNDKLRDHTYQFGELKTIFQTWQEYHQVKYKFRKNGFFDLYFPSKNSVYLQKTDNILHIPYSYQDQDKIDWYCSLSLLK